jgi:hypothetical protein
VTLCWDATLKVTQLYGYSPVRPPTQQPSRNTLNCKLRSADCCCHLLIRTALKLASCLGANPVEKTNISYQKHKSLSLPSGRHLSCVQLTASLKSNLCTVLTTLKTTKIINSHVQDTTALQPNVFWTAIHRLLAVIFNSLNSPWKNWAKVLVVLLSKLVYFRSKRPSGKGLYVTLRSIPEGQIHSNTATRKLKTCIYIFPT